MGILSNQDGSNTSSSQKNWDARIQRIGDHNKRYHQGRVETEDIQEDYSNTIHNAKEINGQPLGIGHSLDNVKFLKTS